MSGPTLSDLLALVPVQRSIVALLIASVGLPIVGVLIVGLDVVAVRFAMMHVALLGIAIGMLVGIEPTLVGLALCALAGASLAPLAGRPGGLSGPTGFLMTVAIAGALLVLSVSGVNAVGAFELLWGSLLATRTQDVVALTVVCIAVVAVYLARRRPLALLLYDRELALCSGVAVGGLTAVVLVTIAVAIAAAVHLTGALLVDAVTLLPALAARNVATSLDSMVRWAVGFGLVGNALGFFLALLLDLPPGPVLVLMAGALTLATYFYRRRS
ncbi:MAG: metal ABC transporter permease [Chloroflexota bacterium]